MLISLKRWELVQKCVEVICRLWCLQLNSVIARTVLHDLSLPFEGKKLTNLISLKQWELLQNVWKSFVEFDIYHRMALLQKLYSMTLTYFLKVKTFKMLISLKRWELVQKSVEVICGFLHFPSNGVSAKFVNCDLDLYFAG